MMIAERTHVPEWRTSLLVIAGITAVALVFLSGCAPSRYQSSYYAQPEMDDVEYLSSYGVWIYTQSYGMVWSPNVVPGWQPFYYGHWIWTVDGWAWASYEPYGWLVYHYGYWGFDPGIGWFWMPGETWYPARVQWYRFGNYAGWAPIPPPGIVWVDPWVWYDVDIWIVTEVDDFTSENVGRYRVDRPVYQERIDRRTVARSAPAVDDIESATRKKVPVVEVREQEGYMRHRTIRGQPAGDGQTVRAPRESGERSAADQPDTRERTEADLKRMVLPKVERRKVEKNAPRVEKEVLIRRKTEEAPRRTPEEQPRRESSEEQQDTRRRK